MSESTGRFGKAILYAGGGLAELYPLTQVVPKALLPVYDKPLVYYPLSVIMLAGIKHVALVTRPHDRAAFERLLADGSAWGIRIEYFAQAEPGPAQSLLTAREFIAGDAVALVEGDSLICGEGLQRVLSEAMRDDVGATVLAHPVGDARRHTVVETDDRGRPRSIEDRPSAPRSQLATMGVSLFDHGVIGMAESLAATRPDGLTTAELHRRYLAEGRLRVRTFGRGFAWLDTSTHAALLSATNFIETIETAHGLKIGCLEEIAYGRGWITRDALVRAAESMPNGYGQYLERLGAIGP
jgi:glucose-1-phosphate thymidylyltransferase